MSSLCCYATLVERCLLLLLAEGQKVAVDRACEDAFIRMILRDYGPRARHPLFGM